MVTTFIVGELVVAIGFCFGKFLLKHYLGEFAEAATAGFLDLGKDRLKETIKDARTANKAQREYDRIGEEVIARIESDLQSMMMSLDEPRPDPNKILRQYQKIFSGRLAATFVVRKQIDPQKLADAIRSTTVPQAETLTETEQHLFNNFSDRIAQYLYRAASKLPQFDATREEESVATLLQLGTEVTEVLEDARAIREQVVTRPLTDEVEYETSYRNAVVAELDKVELFGVDLPPELKESRLTDAYVTLRLRPAAKDEDDDESSESNGDTDADTLPADAAFDRLLPAQKRVLIRGGAGCGKTTLVRWAAIQAARGTSQERRSIPEYERTKDGDFRLLHPEEQIVLAAEWRRKMPFVITLRNCPDGKLPSPEQFPTQIGNEIGNPTPQWVQRLLHAGHGLILIDGIDEVSKQNHRELFGSIKRLCEAFPKNYFVLTTRPHAITGVRFEDLSFIATEVEPLEDNDRDLFIQHWFLAIASKLSLSAAKTQDLQQDAINLTKFISQTPWLAQLATTPLYCAMTCALFRHRRGTLPQGLRAMCETLCEMTVDRRDRERNLPLNTFPAEFGKLTYEQKKLLLRRLACHFVLAEKSTIQFPDAVEQVKKTLAGMLQRSERDAQAIFDGLLVRSGMLRLASEAKEDKPAIVEFVHNTFKEFLAGEQLADEANA
ncbi:MAG TPA: NACHT domain-containing protein, partial [Gemmata sp.]|nr:NACHT domain-containing protein [Gemmata sp.]